MRVYEKRPSGLAVGDLRSYAATHPGEAVFAVVRTFVGLAMFAFFNTRLGVVLFFVGLALLASTVPFVRRVADAAMIRPCLVLSNRPKWDGVSRRVWELDAGDVDLVAVAGALSSALDGELGESIAAFEELGEFRGDVRNAVLSAEAHAPGQVAWAVSGAVSIIPGRESDGVWLRLERVDHDNDASKLKVTVVSNEGPATAALATAAVKVAA
ncbi:MAG: hypothetical protein M9952_05270 [Microthrixaceae bacterium]|nr:hypothetical protein [Microthrixaceae bacterium]MCO5312332.1 hypothetical protein [Microthrixaceae bacterium]